MGAWGSLLSREILLFCGERLHPAEGHDGWDTVLPEKAGNWLLLLSPLLGASPRLPVTLHLGPREDGQSEHGQQAIVALPKSCGKMKMLPASTSKT